MIEKVGEKFENNEDKFSNEQFEALLKKIETSSINSAVLPALATD